MDEYTKDWKIYRKVANILAKEMQTEFKVLTREGIMTGEARDFLCVGIEGEHWIIKRSIFLKTYEEVKEK